MSSSLSNLSSQYTILSNTYLQAIKEYKIENQENIKKKILILLKNGLTKSFYVGKYPDLSTYFTEKIKSIDIYDGLIITLYTETNFNGDSQIYMSTKTNDFSTEEIDMTYRSLKVELLNKEHDTYLKKKFSSNSNPQITDILNSSQCADLCVNSNCSAAVFNSSLSTCSVYTSPGTLDKGTLEDETIIPANKRKLLIISELNSKLKYIIQQIHANTTTVLKENELSLSQNKITLDQYNIQKKEIQELQTYLEQQKQEYQSLESELTNSSSIIMRNVNTYYLMWIFLIFLIIMILKNIFNPNKSSPNNLFWIILIICIVLASYNINNPYGYLLWCILILIFVLKIILPRI